MQRHVIVYDGTCQFCLRQMNWIRRRDRGGRFEFVPSQSPDLLERFPTLAGEDLRSGLRFVLPDGRVRVGADAVYEIVRRLPRLRGFAWLYRVPGARRIGRRVYRWIAARRHRLGGSCGRKCGPDAAGDEGGSG